MRETTNITVRLNDDLVAALDEYVGESDMFEDRSKVIRYAIRSQLQRKHIENADND